MINDLLLVIDNAERSAPIFGLEFVLLVMLEACKQLIRPQIARPASVSARGRVMAR